MADSLRKFVQRSPRYVLRPQDRKVMRFSLENTHGEGGIEKTLLLNLSETGIAFLVDAGFEPRVGDKIKVEIPIPSGDQIAWWARVVRVSEYGGPSWFSGRSKFEEDSDKVVVALRFENLPTAHSRAIREGLRQSFIQAVKDQNFRDWMYYRQNLIRNVGWTAFYFLITVLAIGFIYWASRPDANYDPKRGAPWGERFKF